MKHEICYEPVCGKENLFDKPSIQLGLRFGKDHRIEGPM